MDTENNKHSLKEKILQKIAKGNVSPRSRYWFVGYELFVWVLWLLAMAIGSLAIAVSLFFIKYNYYALFEATAHDSFFGFLLEALPYLWFFVLGTMLFWAIFNLRQTCRGYRYPLWQTLGLCLSFSVFGGLALYISGVGFSFDRWLGDSIAIYESREKIAIKFWQKPEEGRLVGVFVDEYLVEEDKVKLLFEDITGVSWRIDVSEITDIDEGLLFSQKLVTLVGYMLSTETEPEFGTFHICGVLPWVYEKEKSMKELELRQRRAREGLWRYKNDETLTKEGENNLMNSLCANIKIVDKLRPLASN